MKKLNRKGFTLIELLAVIVILAIVLVVTIPSVIRSMDKARDSQLQNATDSVAEWFQKQYELQELSSVSGGAEAAYTTFMTGKNWILNGTIQEINLSGADGDAVLKAAGIGGGSADVTGKVYLKDTTSKKVCVKLSPYTSNDTNPNPKPSDKFKGVSEKTSSGC